MKRRNGTIDLFKLLFAFIVILAHLSTSSLKKMGYHSINGHISVEFFFIVSGFLVAKKSETCKDNNNSIGENVRNFAMNKFVGLFPPLFVSSLAYILWDYHVKVGRFTVSGIIRELLNDMPTLFMLQMLGFGEQRCFRAAWYVPVLFITSIFVFSLLLKYKDSFYYILAPFFALFGSTYIFHKYGKILVLASEEDWIGFTYADMIRGLVGICLGVIGYKLYLNLSEKKSYITKAGVCFFSLLEFVLYFVLIFMIFHGLKPIDSFIYIIVFAILVPISFSEISVFNGLLDKKVIHVLGDFSYYLYLAQWYSVYYWAPKHRDMSIGLFITSVLLISVISAVFLYMFTKLLFFILKIICSKLKAIIYSSDNI